MNKNRLSSIAAILEKSNIQPDLFETAAVSNVLSAKVIERLMEGDIPCTFSQSGENEARLIPIFSRADAEYLLLNLSGLSQERIKEVLDKSGLY